MDKPAVRADNRAEETWTLYMSYPPLKQRSTCFNSHPKITKNLKGDI